MTFVREFLHFLTSRRKLWLWPLFVVLLVFGAVFVFAQGSVLAPFLYTLF